MSLPKKPQSIDFQYWLRICVKELNIQPSEFWKMPFFLVYETIHQAIGGKDLPNRAEILDGMRERKRRLKWQ